MVPEGHLASSQFEFLSDFEGSSVPNDELASQNKISEPEEIEDSNASDFIEIQKKNEVKRKYNRQNFEGGSDGGNNEAASCVEQ